MVRGQIRHKGPLLDPRNSNAGKGRMLDGAVQVIPSRQLVICTRRCYCSAVLHGSGPSRPNDPFINSQRCLRAPSEYVRLPNQAARVETTHGDFSVLITDGNERAALAAVRSLGAAGYRCVVCGSSGHPIAGASKFASSTVRLPDPANAPEQFVSGLAEVVRNERVQIVIPVTEASLFALLPVKEQISANIPFPELTAFLSVTDKARVLKAAEEIGIRVPDQRVIEGPGQTFESTPAFPLVLKPIRSVYTAGDGTRGKVGVEWVHSAQELEAALHAYPQPAFPILAQQVVSGPGIGIFVLVHAGRLLAQFSHRRIREKPPAGGVSVVRQSEPMDRDLLERSLALLESLGWSGVAMVEYKRDERTGEAFLMEINGRFWGSLQLAIDAGVDFPRLLADVSLGRTVEPVDSYDFARCRWFWGDVDHLIARWRDPSAGWRDRARSLSDWLRGFGPGYRSEVFRWSDPGPFLRESARWIADLGNR